MIKRILLTNDDGIDAPGLTSLAMVLGGSFEVYVVAPDQERSGVGHGFTLYTPLRCDEAPAKFPPDLVKKAWKCSGTPVDCVKMGLLTMLKETPPDLVVSGINRGANLAVDTIYSGTVSGAMEGMIMGKPAIAVSLVSHLEGTATHEHFTYVAEYMLDYILQNSAALKDLRGYCLNINVPGLPRTQLKGTRYTRLGKVRYDDRFQVHRDPGGRPYYWLQGSLVVEDPGADSDIAAVREHYVSVTPLTNDMTAMSVFEKFAANQPPLQATTREASASEAKDLRAYDTSGGKEQPAG